MQFKEYEDRAIKTALYPYVHEQFHPNLSYDVTYLIYPAFKLTGEAGEVTELLGKIVRDKNFIIDEDDRQKLKKELGDVLWYINAIAAQLDFSLEDIAQANLDKVEKRLEKGMIHGSGGDREEQQVLEKLSKSPSPIRAAAQLIADREVEKVRLATNKVYQEPLKEHPVGLLEDADHYAHGAYKG